MAYQREREVAVAAVLNACRLCEAVRAALVSAETLAKKDKSPVTVADFGAQALVNAELANAFPNDPIVAEEDAAQLREAEGVAILGQVIKHVRAIKTNLDQEQILAVIDRGKYPGGANGRHWTLDPIDGTKGFLRNEQYAVALALIENGLPVLGVLGCPNLPLDARRPDGPKGCMFIAVRGQGAVSRPLDGHAEARIRVTNISDPAKATFCESVESAHSAHGHAARVAELLGVTVPPYRVDSQCKYAAVARGDASIYLRLPTQADYQEKIWDHAAGYVVITEAGGQVSDAHGEPLDFSLGRTLRNNRGVVATNGRLHEATVRAIRQVLG